MKRFIDLRGQINDRQDVPSEFAFYDTIIDAFEEFSGSQTWRTVTDFLDDYIGTEPERYLGLMPKWVPK